MGIIDRVKFDGLKSRDWLVYKHHNEKLVFGTQLIVNEGQAAIFVKGGQIFDVFSPGTYTLSPNNLPLLSTIINLVYGNSTPFTAEIYFINLTSKLNLYWGTSDPIQLIDPKYHIKLRVRAFGQLAVRLDDHLLFFREIIGSLKKDELVDFEKVQQYFKGAIISYIKAALANKIIKEQISALEISTELQTISDDMKKKVSDEFNSYGFSLLSFQIQSINFPDEDFEQINKLLQDKAKFEMLGDNYEKQRRYDVYEKAVSSDLGIASALFASTMRINPEMNLPSKQQPIQPPDQLNFFVCPSCHYQVLDGSKFCNTCGDNLSKNIQCLTCGKENLEHAKFCSTCGTSLANRLCECGNKLKSLDKFCNECGMKVS